MILPFASYPEQLREVRQQLQNVDDPHQHADRFLRAGRLARIVGETAEARHDLGATLVLYSELADPVGQVQAQIELAYCDRLTGNYRIAFIHLRAAHDQVRRHHVPLVEQLFWIAYVLGLAQHDRAFSRRAQICFEYALQQAGKLDRLDLRALALSRIADLERQLDEDVRNQYRDEAIVVAEQCQQLDALVLALGHKPIASGLSERQRGHDLAKRSGSAELMLEAGARLASSLRRNQQAAQAIELAHTLGVMAHELGYLRLEALCKHNLGIYYRGQGRYRAARTPLLEAVTLQRQIGSRRLTISLAELGITYLNTGEYDLGMRCVREAYQIHERRRNKLGMQLAARNIGIFYHRLNHWPQAKWWYDHSRGLAIERQGAKGQSYLTGNLSSLFQAWARHSEASQRNERLQQALAYVDQAIIRTEALAFPNVIPGKPSREAKYLPYTVNLGRKGSILLDLKRPDEARPYLYRAYRLTRDQELTRRLPKRLLGLARAYEQLGRVSRALALAAVAIYRANSLDNGFSVEAVNAYHIRAQMRQRCGDLTGALADYTSAIELAQKSFGLLQDQYTGIQSLVDIEKIFSKATLVAWQLKLPRQAFDLLEAGRAPVFRGYLATTTVTMPPSIPQVLSEREQPLLERLESLREDIIGSDQDEDEPQNIEDVYHQMVEVQQALQAVWSDMAVLPQAEEYVGLRSGRPHLYEEIRRCLSTEFIAADG